MFCNEIMNCKLCSPNTAVNGIIVLFPVKAAKKQYEYVVLQQEEFSLI